MYEPCARLQGFPTKMIQTHSVPVRSLKPVRRTRKTYTQIMLHRLYGEGSLGMGLKRSIGFHKVKMRRKAL